MPGELLIHYGNPGAGKTLFAMQDIILPCVRDKRPFFTNITGISISALSALTDVHQAFIKYYPVADIHDVIKYFDDEAISHNGVFVLDEMKDFIDNDKAVSWLESRINVMRKHSVDFVLIAQQPKKNYIHPDIISLANACNVFRSRKRENDPEHVTQYYVNGGMPKIVDNTVSNAVGEVVRKKPVQMYNCFETSESAFYTGAEDNTHFGLKWYQERKWKFRFAIIAIFVVFVGLAIFLMVGIFKFAGTDLGGFGKLDNKAGQDEQQEQVGKKAVAAVAPDSAVCFAYLVCDAYDCTTDRGVYPRQLYNDDSGVLCADGLCMRKCEGRVDVPDGGGLLRLGK